MDLLAVARRVRLAAVAIDAALAALSATLIRQRLIPENLDALGSVAALVIVAGFLVTAVYQPQLKRHSRAMVTIGLAALAGVLLVQLAFVVPVAPYGADAGRHLFLVGFSLTGQGDQWARTLGHESLPALVRDIGADHIPDAWGRSYLVNAIAYSLCYLVFLVTTVAAIGTVGKKS